MEQKSGGITLRACKNTLGRLKVQILFRLAMLFIALIPLMTGLGAWRLWLILIGLGIGMVPEAILLTKEDFAAGVLSASRAYDIIGYEGFFPERKIDTFLHASHEDKKSKILFWVIVSLLGFGLNIRSIVRLCASFFHINLSLPHHKGKFSAYWKRFCEGLGLTLTCAAFCFFLVTLASNGLIDVFSRTAKDPYRFRGGISDAQEMVVADRIAAVLEEEAYFYYVEIPFNENGFDVNTEGKQSASYLAQISHATGTQQMWEIILTLNEDRSGAWSDAANVTHPVHFDPETQQEIIYVSGDEQKTLHYRDDSGTYVQVAQTDAPAAYQALLSYIFDGSIVRAWAQDTEHLAADADEGFIHLRYETETSRITMGVKDDSFPYEFALTDGEFSYASRAFRFDNIHPFSLP